MRRIYVIGIAGPSGAGKTCLAERLASALNAQVLAIDRYYRDLTHLPLAQRAGYNFDHPDSLESDLLYRHLAQLREGKTVDVPVYDFATHTRLPQIEPLQPFEAVIVEGVFALYWPELRRLMDTRIYIDLHLEECLQRRTDRDVRERGRTPDSVRQQFASTVAPMAEKYVRPCASYADVVVSGFEPLESSLARILAHHRERTSDLALQVPHAK